MILVFGSINVDLVLPVPRWPVPGETVLGGDVALLSGGKGANQALAARRAGAEVALVGAVGEDAFAEIALAGLRQHGVDLNRVARVALPTGCASILVVPGGENLIAVSSGANASATAAAVPDAMLGPATVLVIQMELPALEVAALICRARARGACILLNLAPAPAPGSPVLDAGALAAIDWLVTNAGEAASLGESPETIARMVRRGLVITRGEAGATAYLADGGRIAVPALTVTPIDTTGAGDIFTGVLAAGLDAKLEPEAALRRAAVAASLGCLVRGAQAGVPDAADIDAAFGRSGG